MTKQVEVRGFEELSKRMSAYPVKYTKVMAKTHVAANLTIQENIPPYPPQPTGASYRRTGTLGRSFGVAIGGGRVGMASIFTVRKIGRGASMESRVGSSLRYAADVVGDNQKPFFAAYWWKFSSTIGKAFPKIKDLFTIASEELAKFLEGKGL